MLAACGWVGVWAWECWVRLVYLAKPWQALASCVMLVFVCSCNVVASHHTLAVCAVCPSFVLESWSLAVVGTVTRGVGLFYAMLSSTAMNECWAQLQSGLLHTIFAPL